MEGIVDTPSVVVTQHGGDINIVSDTRVVFHRIEPKGAVSGECQYFAVRVSQFGGHGVGDGSSQMAQGPQALMVARHACLQE